MRWDAFKNRKALRPFEWAEGFSVNGSDAETHLLCVPRGIDFYRGAYAAAVGAHAAYNVVLPE
jgi:hypothetical protein